MSVFISPISPHTQFPPFSRSCCIPYLHEEFDMFVFSQEVLAETHPLWYQVQELLFPLQSLLPVLFPSVTLGAIGGGLVKVRFASNQMQFMSLSRVSKSVGLMIGLRDTPAFKDIIPAELDINHWWTWTLGRSAKSRRGAYLQTDMQYC